MAAALAIDTLRRVATPEGCEIALRIAGPVTRARAWLFDALIRVVLWWVFAMIAAFTGKVGAGLFMLSLFLLEWFYPVLFEVYMRGQTPGKKACGLVVLHDDGRPVGWGGSFIRNTLRFVDFLPLLYATGFIATLCNAEGKRLGDLAAGTVVAHVETPEQKSTADDATGSEAPPFPLNVEEQQALIEYRNRAGTLTEERAEELAELATPLTGRVAPRHGRQRLLRMANFLLGQR